jgi:hypothetical protein
VVRLGFPLPSHFPHRAGKTRFIGLLDCLTGAKPVPLHAVHAVSDIGNFSRNFFKLGRPPDKVNPINSTIFKSRMKPAVYSSATVAGDQWERRQKPFEASFDRLARH